MLDNAPPGPIQTEWGVGFRSYSECLEYIRGNACSTRSCTELVSYESGPLLFFSRLKKHIHLPVRVLTSQPIAASLALSATCKS